SSSRSEVAALAGDMTVLDLVGSYAGAMGYGQFISSSYRKWAIDFDGDRSRDIWNNTTDAIGSVANYFAEHGWKGARPAFEEVVLASPDAPAAEFASTGLDLTRTVREWKELGVQTDGKDQAKAALFRMEAEGGNEYWLGYHDYYVISRYNRSAL
ncbi:MAG: lytic murein transglycosylase, partial [Pseudomonadales bacterium]|nr:lytic murein transglycosylase [Pseudomonadales bacterium]